MNYFNSNRQYVLFIPGIFPEDCPDEIDLLNGIGINMESLANDSEDDADIPDIFANSNLSKNTCNNIDEYDDIPEYFIDIKYWPKSVKRLCCVCSNQISNFPWPIPIGLHKKIIGADNIDN